MLGVWVQRRSNDMRLIVRPLGSRPAAAAAVPYASTSSTIGDFWGH